MGKLGYWPGTNNVCTTREKCEGAGSEEHIRHTLEEMTIQKLMAVILGHCGNSVSPCHGCMCCFAAEEIGRRATVEGVRAHRMAVEARNEFFNKKYPRLDREGRIARCHFGIGLPNEIELINKEK